MTILVAAIKDYINANNALSDFTATASTNVLTMTSVAFGPRAFSTCTISVGGGSPASIAVASIRTGTGVYSITEALSPAISMTITAPAVAGVQAAIDETITFEKGLSAQSAIRDDAVAKLSALSVFNGDANSIYSIGTNSNDVRFISTEGGDHSALTIAFKTIYDETDYSETQFGGNLSSTVSVVTAGVDRSVPLQVLTVTFPDGTTSQKTLEGTFTRAQMTAEYNTLANANSGWNTVTDGTSVVTATAATIGIISANFSGSIASLYSGSSPSGVTFTGAQTRAGRSAYNTTDRITLTPPVGNAITINFDSTTAYNPDSGSSPTNVVGITATEIATALQAAWSDTTYFTVARSGAILTFTGTNRGAITGTFAYTIVNGDTRTGTLVSPLITNSVSGNISTTEGIDRLYGKMTRVTITLNSTTGSTVIFDRHYGEGPGRLLDPDFTAGANDLPYGDSGAANAADYLNLYYDPDKTQSGTELAKPNGTVANTLTAMQAALAAINSNQYVLVVPDSTSSPTSIQISPSQFSSSANYVTTFSPATQVVVSSVAPTTTALTAVAEGNTVATGSPTQSTSGTDINTTFSIVRPWASGLINPTKVFPVFAESGYISGTLFNRLRAADLGYDFGGTNYISYFERSQMSITPNFDTETVETIALWADGGTIETVGGEPQRATLQVRSRGTNYSGENAYLTVAEDNTQTNAKKNKLVVNDFVVGSAYKVDTRIQGRFINYRVDDALASTASGYVASNNKAWNISGLQLKVRKGGDR